MKKIFLILVGTVFSLIAYSQVPLVEYKPVTVPPNNNSGNGTVRKQDVPLYSSPSNSQQQFKTIGAYYYDASSQDFKRIKIKINPIESDFGGTDIYVRAVLNRSSHIENWTGCNNRASKIDELFDTDIVVNNFEWKVSGVSIGGIVSTIYFNY